MLRPGRLGTLLFVDLPGEKERIEILQTLRKIRNVQMEVDLEDIAKRCDGFSGADLESLLRAAGIAAIRRNGESIEMQDFEIALGKVKKSVKDVGKYRQLKQVM